MLKRLRRLLPPLRPPRLPPRPPLMRRAYPEGRTGAFLGPTPPYSPPSHGQDAATSSVLEAKVVELEVVCT